MQRRTFHKMLAALFGTLTAALVVLPGVGFLLDPLRGRRKRDVWRPLVALAELELNVPRKVVLRDRRIDAWVHFPEGPIGAVWLVRRGDRDVRAFTVTCPHLSCPVDYVEGEAHYFCACHGAVFAPDGLVVSGPALRGLDTLPVRIEPRGGSDWVSVVFQKFSPGTEEKTPLG